MHCRPIDYDTFYIIILHNSLVQLNRIDESSSQGDVKNALLTFSSIIKLFAATLTSSRYDATVYFIGKLMYDTVKYVYCECFVQRNIYVFINNMNDELIRTNRQEINQNSKFSVNLLNIESAFETKVIFPQSHAIKINTRVSRNPGQVQLIKHKL
jgi:hypothetical protein